MARKAKNGVIVDRGKRGTVYAIRFRAYGSRRYLTLGTSDEGWNRKLAEDELANVMADVRRGTWRDPRDQPKAPEPEQEPTFHEFASEWFERHRREWRQSTEADYRWQLSNHLLPWFGDNLLSEITVEAVDRYKAMKVREGALGPTSINKTLTRLAAILEDAVEYGRLDKNPAKGRRRRVKQSAPRRTWLDRADQVESLLEAAGEMDKNGRGPRTRRSLLATLAFAGLRLGEALALRWRDVDLAGGRLAVIDSKTDAGVRTVDLLPPLREELAELRASRRLIPNLGSQYA